MKIPDHILSMAARLRTQNNRGTADPIFVVRVEQTYPAQEGYIANGWEVRDVYGLEASPMFDNREDAKTWATNNLIDDYNIVPVFIEMSPVAYFLTEHGAQCFIAANGHRLKNPDIFAESMYRMTEMVQLRRWLMTLGGGS